ncbi:MAG: hypothetical protein BM565_11475 [Gammaproteobacteria bacterium MedPE]|nr:MAG: hypothetical protein BM565_11475 [Gammaproteobacteria bacterium MedPE]
MGSNAERRLLIWIIVVSDIKAESLMTVTYLLVESFWSLYKPWLFAAACQMPLVLRTNFVREKHVKFLHFKF